MPLYLYKNPANEEEIVEIFQSMNDTHEYTVDGVHWKRVWQKPQASFDTKVDPYSSKDFLKATAKKDTIGAMQDRSQELSEIRRQKDGKDLVKEKYYDEYAAKRKGKKHPDRRKQELQEKTKGIATIEL